MSTINRKFTQQFRQVIRRAATQAEKKKERVQRRSQNFLTYQRGKYNAMLRLQTSPQF